MIFFENSIFVDVIVKNLEMTSGWALRPMTECSYKRGHSEIRREGDVIVKPGNWSDESEAKRMPEIPGSYQKPGERRGMVSSSEPPKVPTLIL